MIFVHLATEYDCELLWCARFAFTENYVFQILNLNINVGK